MEYQALYRKHRPQAFSQVVGQRHVTDTLAREVLDGKVAHAYLFAGPRGTGKTTSARILAKALNCANPRPDGEPDNECDSCVAITEGSSLDVIELDAASHNKVEDVREIRVNVGTVASVGGRRRVYILDEAHMLSRAAGNALLKTLEEPPEHVIFVLATTEPYKLLDTIRSRSQRFDFHPIGVEVLADYLAEIAAREGFTVEPGSLALIAQHARGSVRDGLSLMEQVAALGDGTVARHTIGRALGLAEPEAYSRLAAAVAGQDAPAGLALVAAVAAEGADLRRFVADAIGFFRGIFLAQYAPNLEEIVDEGADTIAAWRAEARKLSSADVLRAIDLLGEALLQLREGREERLVVELTMLRLTRPETSIDPVSLSARLDRLEERLRRAPAAAAPADTTAPAPVTPAPAPVPPAPAEEEPTPPPEPAGSGDDSGEATFADLPPAAAGDTATVTVEAGPLDLDQFEAVWPALAARVRDEVGPRRNAWFRETRPAAVDGRVVTLEVPAHLTFHLEQLRVDDVLRGVVETVAGELLGAPVQVRYEAGADGETRTEPEAPERVPADHELGAAAAGAIDPTDLVVDLLGGEVVDD